MYNELLLRTPSGSSEIEILEEILEPEIRNKETIPENVTKCALGIFFDGNS